MNKGVLQSSSPVQQMMSAGNPNWRWNVNGIRPPPPLPLPDATPVFFGGGGGGAAPSNLFPDHQLYVPAAASSASSSSPSSSSSWQDLNNPELPESWSQLLLGGFVGEDHKSNSNMSHFQDQQSQDGLSATDHVKQENSISSYNNNICGHANDHQQDFRLGAAATPTPWPLVAPVSSSARSCTTSIDTNDVLDFSRNKSGARQPSRDRTYECNSNANGGAQKKARVQPSSSQSTFKVKKEKLGDRITALHQLVSPFGKTDTASVLLEAIGYIRFLQSQIEALSSPYLGKGSGHLRHPVQREQNIGFHENPSQLFNGNGMKRKRIVENYNDMKSDHEEEAGEQRKLELRNRGLCLVPISCTLEVGNDRNNTIGADYWAAAANSFGGGAVGLFH